MYYTSIFKILEIQFLKNLKDFDSGNLGETLQDISIIICICHYFRNKKTYDSWKITSLFLVSFVFQILSFSDILKEIQLVKKNRLICNYKFFIKIFYFKVIQ